MDLNTQLLCFRCGICCTRYDVPVTFEEAHKLADFLKIDWQTWLSNYTNPAWPGVRSMLLVRLGGECVFLTKPLEDNSRVCLIHSVRPAACRDWQAGIDKIDCRNGLAKSFGLSVSDSSKITGNQKDIDIFEHTCPR